MNQADIAALMKGVAPVLRDTISRAVQPIIHRLIALEAREPRPGEPGDPGKPGKDGEDGRDADMEALNKRLEELVAAIPKPEDGKDAYPGMARGLFDPEAAYRAMDVVSFNGSEWRAKRDAPGPLPGDGWMLSASKGKRGETGKGEPGKPGKPGKDGASPIEFRFDPEKMMLVMVLNDGNVLEADFYPVAQKMMEGISNG